MYGLKDEEDYPIGREVFKNLGYSSTNIIYNLGTQFMGFEINILLTIL